MTATTVETAATEKRFKPRHIPLVIGIGFAALIIVMLGVTSGLLGGL